PQLAMSNPRTAINPQPPTLRRFILCLLAPPRLTSRTGRRAVIKVVEGYDVVRRRLPRLVGIKPEEDHRDRRCKAECGWIDVLLRDGIEEQEPAHGGVGVDAVPCVGAGNAVGIVGALLVDRGASPTQYLGGCAGFGVREPNVGIIDMNGVVIQLNV